MRAGQTVVEEGHGQIGYNFAAIADAQPAIAAEIAQVAKFHVPKFSQIAESFEIVWGNRHDHPLLGLRQPYLPWRQAGILEQNMLQLDVCTQLFGHLANRGRKPSCAAIGNGIVEMLVPGGLNQLN